MLIVSDGVNSMLVILFASRIISLGKLHNDVSLVQNTFSYNMQINTLWLQLATFKSQTNPGLSHTLVYILISLSYLSPLT